MEGAISGVPEVRLNKEYCCYATCDIHFCDFRCIFDNYSTKKYRLGLSQKSTFFFTALRLHHREKIPSTGIFDPKKPISPAQGKNPTHRGTLKNLKVPTHHNTALIHSWQGMVLISNHV